MDKERQVLLGRVSTEVDARLSFDKERQVEKENQVLSGKVPTEVDARFSFDKEKQVG